MPGRIIAMSAGQNNQIYQQQGSTASSNTSLINNHHIQPRTSSNASNYTSGGGLLNTEIRAQARKEREAIRERGPQTQRGGQVSSSQQQQQYQQHHPQQHLLHNVGVPGRERSSSILSSHNQIGERKISPPKSLMAKKSTEYDGRCSSVASRTTNSRHGRKISTGPVSSDVVSRSRPPLQPSQSCNTLNYSGEDESSWYRKQFDLPSRIPSPPTSDDSRDFDPGQTAYFVKYYYEMVEKCQSWQRYAANMKAKSETLDLENKILHDINEKQERDIRALEAEIIGLKQASLFQEEEKRSLMVVQGAGSAHSDAVTVTGDYLQDIVDQKRRLRKVSQDQQQQLQYLQARIHLNSNTSQGSVTSTGAVGGVGGSRPSSRLSNHNTNGLRIRSRSRAGSCTVHDSIPVEKDDVFGSSEAITSTIAPIKRSSSMPLSGMNLNSNGIECETLEVRESKSFPGDASSKASTTGLSHREEVNTSHREETRDISSDPESDRKGAHRRLYIRLRDELETSDLVRFERYVHRYDGLEIPVDGNRGIINRVRRLLLPEELVRSKLDFPDRYKLRKELAREFERIVREDAVPRDASSTCHSQQEESI